MKQAILAVLAIEQLPAIAKRLRDEWRVQEQKRFGARALGTIALLSAAVVALLGSPTGGLPFLAVGIGCFALGEFPNGVMRGLKLAEDEIAEGLAKVGITLSEDSLSVRGQPWRDLE